MTPNKFLTHIEWNSLKRFLKTLFNYTYNFEGHKDKHKEINCIYTNSMEDVLKDTNKFAANVFDK